MAPTEWMTDEQWTQLIEDVAEHFDDLAMKRGFQYYKQGRVRKFGMPDSRRIDAAVMGTQPYSVAIDLDFFAASRCDCPVVGYCKHMAAVLLAFAELKGRPVQQLANARMVAGRQTFPLKRRNAFAPEAPGLASEAAGEETAEQLSRMSIEEWQEWFQRKARRHDDFTRNPAYVHRVLQTFHSRRPALPPVTEQRFRLHALLFLMSKLTRPYVNESRSFGGYYFPYYTELALAEVQKLIVAEFEAGLPLGDDPEAWKQIDETVGYLRRRMLTDDDSEPYFADCYYLVWMNWIAPHLKDLSAVAGELERLKEAGEQLGSSLQRQPWLRAQCRMSFYLGDDPAAMHFLQEAAKERRSLDSDELLYYLWELADAEAWDKLTGWLEAVGPLLANRRGDALRQYFGYWEKAIPHVPGAEARMWELLADMLPWTQTLYEEKLREHGKWREWIDLQLCSAAEPLDYRVSDLRPVEKEAPELLLPFYHQAVERRVLERNRHSYKEAVRLLKRLQKLYQKLKREDRWEAFFSSFSARNSRLRALQEELRKGKLLS